MYAYIYIYIYIYPPPRFSARACQFTPFSLFPLPLSSSFSFFSCLSSFSCWVLRLCLLCHCVTVLQPVVYCFHCFIEGPGTPRLGPSRTLSARPGRSRPVSDRPADPFIVSMLQPIFVKFHWFFLRFWASGGGRIARAKLHFGGSMLTTFNLGPTWANLEPTWSQLGANLAQLGPTWGQLGPTWGQLGPNLGQLGANLGQLGANLGPT